MDRITKFLLKLNKQDRKRTLKIFNDIKGLKLKSYDVRQLKGYKGLHRLRKGNIRIIFAKSKTQSRIVNITFRKDAYK